MDSTVAIQDLRVGMYIHLDLGWMRHPFPLSSFRISSDEQIRTLRGLGLDKVRWVPERSELAAPAAGADELVGAAPPASSGAGADVQAAASAEAAETDRAVAAHRRREALAAQRAGLLRLERQYTEASTALREACRSVREHPQQARDDAEALSRALVDKLLVDGEMCIRLLSSSAGDRAAAHGMNVGVIALLMGRSLGLPEAEMLDLGVGAMLHDLGKLELPDRMRHLDPAFSSAQTNAYRSHVEHGVRLGRQMGLAAGALAVLAQHHEHADGSGFPLHLQGERVGFGARIVALVNRYDNLCNPPTLAQALTPHEALSLLFAQNRGRFDTTILNAFIRMMGVYPAGSLVQLTDDRHALVVAVNSSRPLKPRVLVHDPATPRDEALFVDLEAAQDLGIRRSLAAAKLPPAARDYLAPRHGVAYFFEALAAPPCEASQ